MKNIKVGVLLGGKSKERPGSLRSGNTVIESLRKQNYNVIVIDPSDEGFIEKLKGVDCVFNALHGRYGEDGKIQGLMEELGIKYTGSGVLASAIGMNKVLFKKILIAENIPTPAFAEFNIFNIAEESRRICKELGFPIVIKPISEGGSLGISIAKSEEELIEIISKTGQEYDNLFAERFVKGDFLSVGLLGRYGKPKVLPVLRVEYISEFYDYEVKHTHGAAKYIVPADIPKISYKEVQEYAERIYISLGCHGPLRVDFIYGEDGIPYTLEVNTIPGLSTIGNLPAIAAAEGINYDQLVEIILKSAFNKPFYCS